MSLLCILGGRPEPGQRAHIICRGGAGFPRNPFPETNGPVFAEMRWELYTKTAGRPWRREMRRTA
jgi:hypothetical protein